MVTLADVDDDGAVISRVDQTTGGRAARTWLRWGVGGGIMVEIEIGGKFSQKQCMQKRKQVRRRSANKHAAEHGGHTTCGECTNRQIHPWCCAYRLMVQTFWQISVTELEMRRFGLTLFHTFATVFSSMLHAAAAVTHHAHARHGEG